MNTRLTWSLSLILLLGTGAFAGGCGSQSLVHAQDPQQAEDTPEKSKAKMQTMCPMMAGLKGVDLYADSPPLLSAQAEELGLNDEQKKRLGEISNSARQEAREVLTAEQRQALEKLPQGPLSPMQIAKMRMKTMRKADSKMMCPMCMKMMDK